MSTERVTDLYHGTSSAHAAAIVGPPPQLDVTRGSGEFGRGFYFGTSKGFAKTWAKNRFRESALVQASLADTALGVLKTKCLNHKESEALRVEVGANTKTYLCNVDLVIGTIKNAHERWQFKFESAHAQETLRTQGNLQVIR